MPNGRRARIFLLSVLPHREGSELNGVIGIAADLTPPDWDPDADPDD